MKFLKKQKEEQNPNINLVFHTQVIQNLPFQAQNKLIAIASDYHFIPGQKLIPELSVQKINEQNPDIVLLLGDFITNDPEGIEELALILKNIQSKDGVYAIYGNHDIKWGEATKQRVGKALTEIARITILENTQIFPWGQELPIIGLGDWWSPNKKDFQPLIAFNNIPNTIPRIVLTHNPDSVLALDEYRADLILCGHTHGIERKPMVYNLASLAQFFPSFLQKKIPLGSMSKYEKNNEVLGIYDLRDQNKYEEGRQLIITSGLGSHDGSPRIKIPPELMFIKLQKK